jgi:hypothetical protein
MDMKTSGKTLAVGTIVAVLSGGNWGCNSGADRSNQAQQKATAPSTAPAVAKTGGPQASAAVVRDNKNVDGIQEIGWDDLIPPGYRPDEILDKFNVDGLEDDDPRAQEAMKAVKAAWDKAPVVKEMDGKTVKLPGYVVPLEGDGKEVSEFLLVPYYGACIHVPPPPANQTVYVDAQKINAKVKRLFDTVWVTGRIKIEKTSSELAEAGYSISALKVEPYE